MIYTIYATWTTLGSFKVEANSLEEAKELVYDIPPLEAGVQDYIDDTFEIDRKATGDGSPRT